MEKPIPSYQRKWLLADRKKRCAFSAEDDNNKHLRLASFKLPGARVLTGARPRRRIAHQSARPALLPRMAAIGAIGRGRVPRLYRPPPMRPPLFVAGRRASFKRVRKGRLKRYIVYHRRDTIKDRRSWANFRRYKKGLKDPEVIEER
ncbi:hypothetical protein ALC56_00183 [Trachymyrmex septentrionalis]|uniref:Uncharacterized protein n=1 Tax=Trachymyrmex septentrionalis TaxID=34720 RepID=A0A195FYF4_9HYME|nr:hypothetical protein ALC56_00183 [Trachymyrmex septentrionalis]